MRQTGGLEVRKEAKIPPFGEAELHAVMALKRGKGRPSKKSLNRFDPINARNAAAKDRATTNAGAIWD